MVEIGDFLSCVSLVRSLDDTFSDFDRYRFRHVSSSKGEKMRREYTEIKPMNQLLAKKL